MSCCLNKQCKYDDKCPAQSKLKSSMRRYFGFSSFQPGQLETMLPLMHGEDVFARMATGAGKSLCMFLPPLALSDSACGVVISPLVGLIEQQVHNCAVLIS